MGQPGGGILRCKGDRAGLPGLHKDSGYDEGQGLFGCLRDALQGRKHICIRNRSGPEKCRERVKKEPAFSGLSCNLIEGREEIKMVLEIVKEGDVFFLFSLSGENAFVNELAGRLKAKGVKIISVTKVGNNELSRLSDISLQFYAHPVLKGKFNSDVYMTAQFL